ncbi:GNAT family N-acetyltransferase [Caenimonas koreensis]|uniref:GNAT family N-acetyltransferase n=1 Tax=Caenimonas koreensis TaxID=367474 RepID=UPI0038993E2D
MQPRFARTGGARASIALVPATAADAEDLVQLRIEAMRESLERIGRFDPVRSRERFLSGFAPEFTRHIEVDGQRAGFVVVKPEGATLLLDHLYVRPAFQGQGVGAAVLQEVFDQALRAGCAIKVGALRGSRSNDFYRKHGFVEVAQGEFDIYYMRP